MNSSKNKSIDGTNYTDAIKIYKGAGKFVSVYNEDAWIFSYLFNYKINDDSHVGFPDVALHKVIEKLHDEKISYII